MQECEGKRTFASFSFAARVAKHNRRSRDQKGHVYFCKTCAGFHIGAFVGRRQRKEAK